jgi:hypothetical protein
MNQVRATAARRRVLKNVRNTVQRIYISSLRAIKFYVVTLCRMLKVLC